MSMCWSGKWKYIVGWEMCGEICQDNVWTMHTIVDDDNDDIVREIM